MYLNIFYFTFNTINIYVVHIKENILKILYAQLVAQFVWLFVTLQTVAWQAPLCIAFSRQEYWSGLSFLPPGNLSDPVSNISYIYCIGRQILYHWATWEAPFFKLLNF